MSADIEFITDQEARCAIREAVFIEKHGVGLETIGDELHAAATHLTPHVTARAVETAQNHFKDNKAKLGRVAALAPSRGAGKCKSRTETTVNAARVRPRLSRVERGAQTHPTGFDTASGFTAHGTISDNGEMPHRDISIRP